MTGNEIRETFLRFFEQKGHKRVRSSSLVPVNDPTLLFTNAGMNQFKDVFLGLEQRDYKRATTSQKCVRAGGKHNDLENVGFTNRHHTFFEMLGNFSFGDYFKEDAVKFAWELLLSKEWFAIPLDKLYFTVFGGAELAPGKTLGTDEEAASLWAKVGAPKDRIFSIPGLKENFWAMGDTGPCGPCSEVFYDMGAVASDDGHADCKFPCDCGRYVEIWNLVFMQFNRDSSGAVIPLPKPSVDTGMGLERTAATLLNMQDPRKFSNYDTDLFQPLIFAAAKSAAVDSRKPEFQSSLRIVADHSRAASFLVSDGVIPSNEGRGYVLRKIIRRAIDHSRDLGPHSISLSEMTAKVVELMGEAYPELLETRANIARVLKEEEQRYLSLIEPAIAQLERKLETKKAATTVNAIGKALNEFVQEETIEKLPADFKRPFIEAINEINQLDKKWMEEIREFAARKIEVTIGLTPIVSSAKEKLTSLIKNSQDVPDATKKALIGLIEAMFADALSAYGRHTVPISGHELFYAYDTLGLRPDFVRDVAKRRGWTVLPDADAVFDENLQKQRQLAKASWKGTHKEAAKPVYLQIAAAFKTKPDFYFGADSRDCRIDAIVKAGTSVSEIIDGEEAEIILDHTSIYSESGGQVADTGKLYDNAEAIELAEIKGAYYPVAGIIAHRIVALDTLRVGDRVATVADAARREHIKRNHTATHLMHAALRNILGTHVKQAGSLVEPLRLRFDFSHFAPVDSAELRDIEQQVNEEIRLNNELETAVMPLDEALASGALAFFGDRYPETNVRVVTIPDKDSPRGFYSKELCGGTHVRRSGDIGIFKIVAESSVAAGVRRIEAISGVRGIEEFQRAEDKLSSLASTLGASPDALEATAQKLVEARHDLEKQLTAAQKKSAQSGADDLIAQAQTIKGVRLISAQVPEMSREALRGLVDTLRQKLGSGVVVLGMVEDGKVALIGGVTKDLTAKLHAGKIIQAIAREVGGSGGGRPDLAEAGGKDTVGLNRALVLVSNIINQLL